MATLNQDNTPYVGPRTFRPEERNKFFGRAREARELTALIVSNRLVLFYAPSGAGKSSLLNTRIGPMLVEAGFELLPTGRVSGHSGADTSAANIYVYNLLLSLQKSEEVSAGFERLTLSQFLDNLVQHEDGAYYYDPAYDYSPDTVFKPRVLIIDQFEELVTTNAALWQQRAGFFEQLAEAMTLDEQLWVVLALREDYVARLDPYLHLTPNRLRHRYYMERLTRRAAIAAMQRPVAKVRPFDSDAVERLADNLLHIASADGQDSEQFAQFVEPVQLQAVCYQMWQELRQHPGASITVADVERFANVDKALINFYEDTIQETVRNTDVSEVALRDWFENQLITEAGTRNMVYRGEETTGDLPTPVAEAVLSRFILREEVRPGGVWYELVHDRLVQPILTANHAWRLKQPLPRIAQRWADAGRSDEFLLQGRELGRLTVNTDWRWLGSLVVEFVAASRAAQHRENERDRQKVLEHHRELAEAERRRAEESEAAKRKRGWLMALASVVALIALALMILATSASQEALLASQEARRESTRAVQSLATATSSLATATAAVATEQAAATLAAVRQEEAEVERSRAQSNANLAESRRLVYPAADFLARGNVTGALLVSREIFNISADVDGATTQDKFGPLWLALNATTAGQGFRRPVATSAGLVITNTLLAGPEPETLAFPHQNKIIWWEINARRPVSQTYRLPITSTITNAVFSADRSLLVAVDRSAVYLFRRVGDRFDLSDRQELEETNIYIQAVTISQDGKQLALAFCRQEAARAGSGTDDAAKNERDLSPTPTLSSTSTPTPTPTATATGQPACTIHVTEIDGNDGLSERPLHEFSVEKGPIENMAFIDRNGTALVWSTPHAINMTRLNGQPFKTPPAENDRFYRALTTVDNGEWLVVAGCVAQDGECGEGFIRWWNLREGVWLPEAGNLPASVEKLLYLPERRTLIVAHADGLVQEWHAEVIEWPDLACQIAGRNMTVDEWRETFPNIGEEWQVTYNRNRDEHPRATCSDFKLDPSFATTALLRCEDRASVVASRLYSSSERPTVNGKSVPFVEWAPPILVNELLTDPEGAEDCLAIAAQIDVSLDPDAISLIIESLIELQNREPQEKVGSQDLNQAIGQLAQMIAPADLPPQIAAIFNTYLAALYGESCAYRLAFPEAACDNYARLIPQIPADADTVQIIPILAQRRAGWWLFVGHKEDFLTIALNAPATGGDPYLVLRNVEGRTIASNDDVSSASQDALLQLSLPQDGVYYIEAGWHDGNPGTMPTVRRIEPQTLAIGDPIDVDAGQKWWQFEAGQGDLVSFAIDSLAGSAPYLRLLNANGTEIAYGDDRSGNPNAPIQALLPENGTYYINAQWHDDPAPYTLSVVRMEPGVLAIGDTVDADAAQEWWHFEGSQEAPVTIAMDALEEGGDPLLRLFDANGAEIAHNDDSREGLNSLLQFVPPEDGIYIIRADWYANPGRYRLSLSSAEIETPVVSAIPAESEELEFGQTREGTPEQRRWHFAGSRGDFVIIAMDAVEGDDPLLRLFDANNNQIAFDDDGGAGRNALIQFVLPQDATYYLGAGWYDDAYPGPYTLSLTRVEPGVLAIGEAVEANAGERWWRFEGKHAATIAITVNALHGAVPRLQMLDAGGHDIPYDSRDELNTTVYVFWLPANSLYYVAVSWDDNPGSYRLVLGDFNPDDDPATFAELMRQGALYLVRQGHVTEALALFQDARDLDARDYNEICWYGTLWRYATEVMFACQMAVALEPDNPAIADSRGVARAMTGDFEGAIEDFHFFVSVRGTGPDRDLRVQWIEELTAGRNPFDEDALLERLRHE